MSDYISKTNKTEGTDLSSSQATGDLYKYWSGPRSGVTGWKRIVLHYERNCILYISFWNSVAYYRPHSSSNRYLVI